MSHDSLRSKGRRSRKISRTDSELACEEAAKLTAEIHDHLTNDDDDDDEIDYNQLPPPPDGGYGWVICAASFFCNMIVDGIAYTFGVFLSQFADHFGVGKGTASWIGSLLTGVYLTVGPIVSALCNKYGCRSVCIAGAIIASAAFVLSTFSPTIGIMMLTYGVMGGVGFGMIYLPAVVAVGYYFEKKRSLATGIAVCGSGFGTFVFAPFANYLLNNFGSWKNANLVLAGVILNCAIFGALMRPLTYPKKKKDKPLMQRMAEERKMQMERGSITGSFFTVTMPDGTVKHVLKTPLNNEPGVHSSLALDQLAQQQMHPVATLPTITESKVQESRANGNGKLSPPEEEPTHMENLSVDNKNIPRNASQPVFSSPNSGIPKNGSVPSFNRSRKTSESGGYKPTLGTIADGANVRIDEKRNSVNSLPASLGGSKYSLNTNDEFEFSSKSSLRHRGSNMVRPLSRKDIFYSGSVTNLKEYQSQKSLTDYRQSVVSLTKFERDHRDDPKFMQDVEAPADICPCLNLPPAFKNALSSMLDVTLLKNWAFMLIGVSNLFGMAALYIPFFFLIDASEEKGLTKEQSSSLLSIIGIVNTFARIVIGAVADLPQVDTLLFNNICLVVCTISVALTPFCSSYTSFIVMSIFFGLAIAGYISLTSIILVDLVGLEKLTNAFGLLILFRGAAATFGTPMAGAIKDATGGYDIPFFVGGFLFALSAAASFLAPVARRYSEKQTTAIHIDEVLTPIEENEEEYDEDSQPITMVPKIVKTAPSPSTEYPPKMNGKSKEFNQRESVL